MKIRGGTAAAATVIGALTIAMGTATAHAEPMTTTGQPVIDYSATVKDNTVVARLKGGTFALVDKPGAAPGDTQQAVDIRDETGNVTLEFPLDFRVADAPIPVQPVLKEDGRVLELTAQRPAGVDLGQQKLVPVVRTVGDEQPAPGAPAPAANIPQAQAVASPLEDQRAFADFSTKVGVATTIGSLVGTAIGAVIGCVIGLPVLLAGCIPAAIVGGGIGGIVGLVATGGPTAIATGIQLAQDLGAAPGTSRWADANQVPPPPPADDGN